MGQKMDTETTVRGGKMKRHQIQTRCCVCGRVRVAKEWRMLCYEGGTRYSYTYCPDCYAVALGEMHETIRGVCS